jgi:hypothetical protein
MPSLAKKPENGGMPASEYKSSTNEMESVALRLNEPLQLIKNLGCKLRKFTRKSKAKTAIEVKL